MFDSPQLASFLWHWQQRLYCPSLSTRTWPADLTREREWTKQGPVRLKHIWTCSINDAEHWQLGKFRMCCIYLLFNFILLKFVWLFFNKACRQKRVEKRWIKSGALTDLSLSHTMSVTTWFKGDPSFTHLRKRLSSSSRWCLSFALRLHSSCSDFLMSLFLSKRSIEAKINLDRNCSKVRNNESFHPYHHPLRYKSMLFLSLLTAFCCYLGFLFLCPAVLGARAVLLSSSDWQRWSLPETAVSGKE